MFIRHSLTESAAKQLFGYEQAANADREYPLGEIIIKTGKESERNTGLFHLVRERAFFMKNTCGSEQNELGRILC